MNNDKIINKNNKEKQNSRVNTKKNFRAGKRPSYRRRRDNRNQDEALFNELIQLKRVAKVTAGAKRLRVAVVIAVGDKAGKVGLALAHGADAQEAIQRAIKKAKSKMIRVPIDAKNKTIPHRIEGKYKAARVILKPATVGTGVVAGGSVRKLLSLAGYENVVAKRLGTANPVVNAYCAFILLSKLRPDTHVKKTSEDNKKE